MTRLAMILGLVVLFGLGYAGIERIGLADARIHSVRAARAHAHLAAVIGEMEWAATVEQLRGIAQSAGAELSREWSAGAELDPATLKRRLEVVLDRAGGRGSVAVFSADRRRLASVTPAGSAELDPTVRPVEDARAGAATVQLVGGAAAPTVVAAAPIGSGRVLAVSVVFDRRLIDPWVQAEGPAGDLAIVGPAGELIATTVEAGVPARIQRGTFDLEIAGRAHAASSRTLNDDAGAAGAFVGLSPYDVVLIEAVVKRLRIVYGTLAGLAIALAVFASFFLGPKTAAQDTRPSVAPTAAAQDAWEGMAAEAGTSARAVTADHLMAAARVLEGGGALPAVRHSDQINLPPLRYSAPPPEAPRGSDRGSWGPGSPAGVASRTPPAPAPVAAASRPGPAPQGSSVPPITFGRGMSPAPPAVATGAAPYPGPQPGRTPAAPFATSAPPSGYATTGTYAGYTPLPVVEEDPEFAAAQARLAQTPAPALDAYPQPPRTSRSSEIAAPSTVPRAFDEDHYRGAFDEFVGSKRRLGEPVESINFEGFRAKLRKIEQTLIEKHGCRAVRFQVVVRDRQVSLRPQLVR